MVSSWEIGLAYGFARSSCGSGFAREGFVSGDMAFDGVHGWLRCTYMQWVRLRRTALRASPRMNTSTQPAEGRADQKQARRADTRPVCCSHSPVGARLARDDGLTADQSLQNVLNLCGSEPAREGCVSGDPTSQLPQGIGYIRGFFHAQLPSDPYFPALSASVMHSVCPAQ